MQKKYRLKRKYKEFRKTRSLKDYAVLYNNSYRQTDHEMYSELIHSYNTMNQLLNQICAFLVDARVKQLFRNRTQ